MVDKVSPADRFQVLALLKNVRQYLQTCDIQSSAAFDEPLVTVNNLIYSIEDINILRQNIKGVAKPGSVRKSQDSSTEVIVER